MNRKNGSAVAHEKTSDYYKTYNLPARFEYPSLQDYNTIRRNLPNPFYTTTYNDYGLFSPTVHTTMKCFHGKTQRFGQDQFVRGMYRNNSLNM